MIQKKTRVAAALLVGALGLTTAVVPATAATKNKATTNTKNKDNVDTAGGAG